MPLASTNFLFANVFAYSFGSKVSHSTTVYLDDQTDIFVAQLALTSVIETVLCYVYISGITLSNGVYLDLGTSLRAVEWADTQSVTFVVTAQSGGSFNSNGSAGALASITSYTQV